MDRDAFLVDIKDWLLHTQDLMRAQHDRHHWHVEFQVGQWVWLRLHQRLAASIADKSAGKLHYGRHEVCRVLVAHGKAYFPHGKVFAVCNTRQRPQGKQASAAAVGEGSEST
jgi:hypothetical protein